MAKIVFIIPTGEEAELVYPLYKELINKGHQVQNIDTGTLCCGKNTKLPALSLNELGMPHISIYDYKTHDAHKILEFEKPDVLVIGSDQEYVRRAFLYASKVLGVPIILLDVAFGSNLFRGHWLTTRRTIYRLVYHFFNILNKYCYVLITMIGLNWNIFKIIQSIFRDIRDAFAIEDARGMYGCDVIAVAGTWEKEVLIGRGVKEKQIVVTGNPRMTALFQESSNKESNEKFKSALGIQPNKKVVLFHTSAQVEHGRWNYDMRKNFVNSVIDSLTPLMNNGIQLVIRIHPVESLDEYKDIIKGRKENIILYKGLSFIDSLSMSDAIIFGAYSMMVLEATALGKPAILLNTFNELKNLPYEEMGLAKCLYKYEDIEPMTKRILYDESYRNEFLNQINKFYSKNQEFIDGKATERIVNIIEGLI
jgi:hypothetical protein